MKAHSSLTLLGPNMRVEFVGGLVYFPERYTVFLSFEKPMFPNSNPIYYYILDSGLHGNNPGLL